MQDEGPGLSNTANLFVSVLHHETRGIRDRAGAEPSDRGSARRVARSAKSPARTWMRSAADVARMSALRVWICPLWPPVAIALAMPAFLHEISLSGSSPHVGHCRADHDRSFHSGVAGATAAMAPGRIAGTS